MGASVVFTTDSYEDAKLYAEIMQRNSEEGYAYNVHSFLPENITVE